MRSEILLICLSIVFCASAFGYDWSTNPGDGSPENPYQISTLEQLISLGSIRNLNKHFLLVNDLDLSEHTSTEAVIAPDWDSLESGYQGIPFTGTFNGRGNCISNLTIENNGRSGHFSGLFGYIAPESSIQNLRLENVWISVRASNTGGLCGVNSGNIRNCYVTGTIFGGRDYKGGLCGSNSGTITDCYSSATVYGSGYVGGLCGGNYGNVTNSYSTGLVIGDVSVGGLCGSCGFGSSITDSYATGLVSGRLDVGGLCGYNAYGSMTDCYATGGVSGSSSVGGLCGRNYSGGIITDCYASGSIDATGGAIGGLCGSNTASSVITGCCATGTTRGLSSVGGLCGHNGDNSVITNCYSSGATIGTAYSVGGLCGGSYSSNINNCYSISNTNGDRQVGGLCGLNAYGSIAFCYAVGVVRGREDVGALCGLNNKSITQCYFLEGVSPNNTNGSPLTDEQMRHQSHFIDWDFESVWKIDEGNDYPRLWWEVSNTPPVAEANDITAYAWVDGWAHVQLDGTGSYDEDGNELSYAWYNDANELIAVGAEPNVVFGVGEHVVHLIVNDGIEDSEPDECIVTVIGAEEVNAKLLGGNINPKSKKRSIKARLEFAGEAMPELDAGQMMLLLVGELEIEATAQKLVYSAEDMEWHLIGEFEIAALPELAAGENAVTLVSRYASGQWVYGTDSLKVLNKNK